MSGLRPRHDIEADLAGLFRADGTVDLTDGARELRLAADVAPLLAALDQAVAARHLALKRGVEMQAERDAAHTRLAKVQELYDLWHEWQGPTRAPVPWISFFRMLDHALAARCCAGRHQGEHR